MRTYRNSTSNQFIIFLIVMVFMCLQCDSQLTTANPVWSSCALVKTGLIAVKTTDSGYLNPYTLTTFGVTYSSAFTLTPWLTFSIRNIRGKS